VKNKHASCEEEAWYFSEEDVVPVRKVHGNSEEEASLLRMSHEL
jgi:hypothetical protein